METCSDAFVGDVGHGHARPVGERGKYRHLRGRVGAADVGRGIGFGIAQLLRLLQGVLIVAFAPVHRGQDVVGRPVHDAVDRMQIGRDHALPHHLDDGDGATH